MIQRAADQDGGHSAYEYTGSDRKYWRYESCRGRLAHKTPRHVRKMIPEGKKRKLEELWARGLWSVDPHCPRLSALMKEAVGVGLSPAQVKEFIYRKRKATGVTHWEQEEVDMRMLIALTLGELRVKRGTSLQDEVETIMTALTGLQKTGPQPRAWPSEPRADFSESPPLTPRPAGLAMAFGQDDCGQLGLGIAEEEERVLPTPVVLPPGKTIVDVAAGGLHSAFLTAEGEVLLCGLNDEGELARPNAGEEDCRTVASVSLGPAMVAAQVSCGDSFTAVLDTSGRVFWAGQLRDAGGVFHDIGPRLLEVPLWAPATKIAAGAHHLAVLVGNSIATCGSADRGQLGRVRERRALKRSSRELSLTPSPWTTASQFVDVCCGTYSTIGLTAADDIWGCGNNYLYQLGEGPRTIWMTRKLSALSQKNLVQVALGDDHAVALSSSGAVFCWGDGYSGQAGTGVISRQPIDSPRPVPGLPNNIRQVAAGPRQSFCWTSQGRGYAWGSGVSNQLCLGEEVQEVAAPVPMVGLPGPLQTISVGGQHTLVLVDPSPAPNTFPSELLTGVLTGLVFSPQKRHLHGLHTAARSRTPVRSSEENINECSGNPCKHGRCVNKAGGYKCICPPGWTREHCRQDIDECISKPCECGTCVNNDGGYKCTCSPGWTGQNCQQGESSSRRKHALVPVSPAAAHTDTARPCSADLGRFFLL
ncbi:Regulator of chromosome condensation [Branchiostoma belcheri]|nr:Regulator of chromosome condensation [Branchiostoma belcheri]